MLSTAVIITFALATCMGLVAVSDACKSHGPPRVPQTFVGSVAQGCTPGVIRAVTNLVLNPTKCDLNIEQGCNLCGLRLYIPESTTSQFMVQPLNDDTFLPRRPHIVSTQCRCDEGCYFHRSSITRIGTNPLPGGRDGTVGSFSEPFACYSGISMPNLNSPPKATYLIWCENDGGCRNSIVARFNFLIRFETLSPNRPAVASNFIPKFTSLPASRCLRQKFKPGALRFVIRGHTKKSNAPAKTPATRPQPPRRPVPYSQNFSCRRSKRIARCVDRCMRLR